MNQMDRRLRSRLDEPAGGRDNNDERPHGKGGFWWKFNLIVLGITLFVMYELFPHFTQNVIFDGVIRNGWYFGPIFAILYFSFGYYRRNKGDINTLQLGKHRRPIALVAFCSVVTLLWCMLVFASTDYFAYKMFASNFVARDALIPADPAFVRFEPLQNACNDIANSISTTGEEVECKYVAPIITQNGFGYAAPITPHGVINTLVQKNPGFMLLDDSFAVDNDPAKRLTRIDDEQYYGPGMEWFDNLQYILAKTDFFANYDKPHYLALDPAQPKKLTLVVPKIKYAYLWRLPYWGGVVLVHSDGKIEDLTAEAAMADARLKGRWIYPLWLARYYVQLQNYGTGWGIVTPYAIIQGKLEVETLTGDNQFPFLTQGVDGKSYLVTATKGQGTARGLQRMYFADASTGVGSFHQFGTHEVVYGAGASHDRLTNIPNYQWYHEGDKGSSGTIIAVEPVYLVRPNDPTLYWKFTITNTKYSGISATAVTNSARPDEIKVFGHRVEFESWLHGKEVVAPAPGTPSVGIREELLSGIEALAKQLNALKARVEKLPPSN